MVYNQRYIWCRTLCDLGVVDLINSSATGKEQVKQFMNLNSISELETLKLTVCKCMACGLKSCCTNKVFGEGSGNNGLMFIGEGPGYDEDIFGRPFVGKSGALLDKMLVAVGIERKQSYITNIVKCRPPNNRVPTMVEIQTCSIYLERQMEILKPKIIITLGATALKELLKIKVGITQIRGKWQMLNKFGGIPVMPTFHPAYILRTYTREVRQAVWDDLLAVKERMNSIFDY